MSSLKLNHAAQEAREQMIKQFLKENPHLRRDQIAIRYVNGKIKCEAVSDGFHNRPSGLPKFDPAQLELLGKLEQGKDKRYVSSLQSVQACKQYNEELLKAKACPYNDMDHGKEQDTLARKEYQSAKYALDLQDFKQKLTKEASDDNQTPDSVIQLMTMEYFDASISQIRNLETILTKESHLMEHYVQFADPFLRDAYQKLRDYLNEKSKDTIKKTLALLKKAAVRIPPPTAKEDIIDKEELKRYAEKMIEFENRLSPKRTHMQPVFKLVAFLEGKMEDMNIEPVSKDAIRMTIRHRVRGN